MAHNLFKISDNKYNLFIGDFDGEDKVYEIINDILSMNKNTILDIYISSYGGYFYEYLKIRNAILSRLNKDNISTYILSHAQSCAGMLFFITDNRFIYRDTSLMLHNISYEYSSSSVKNMYNLSKFSKEYFSNFIKETLEDYIPGKDIKRILEGEDVFYNDTDMEIGSIATLLYDL